jgi:hypothetical protein
MSDNLSLTRFLENALAVAHAALDEPTSGRVAQARRYAAEVRLRIKRPRRQFTLGEAAQIARLLKQLHIVHGAIDGAQSLPALRARLA